MAEFKTIETQEELDNIIKSRVDRINAKYADYATIKEELAQTKEKVKQVEEKAAEKAKQYADFDNKIANYESRIRAYESEKMRTKVASDSGLPLEFVDRLKGETEEELKADAQTLLKYTRTKKAASIQTEPSGDNKKQAKASELKGMLDALRKG